MVGVELQATLGETEKRADNLVLLEERHRYLPAAGSPGDNIYASKTGRRSARICSRTAFSIGCCRIARPKFTPQALRSPFSVHLRHPEYAEPTSERASSSSENCG